MFLLDVYFIINKVAVHALGAPMSNIVFPPFLPNCLLEVGANRRSPATGHTQTRARFYVYMLLFVQKYKHCDIQNSNFAFCFVWVWNMVAHIERGA